MSHHITLSLEELLLADQAIGMLQRNVSAVIEQYKIKNLPAPQSYLNDQKLLRTLQTKLDARL